MSRLHKLLNHDITARFLVMLLLAWGLGNVCCVSFFPSPALGQVFLWCLGGAALISLFGAIRTKWKWLVVFVAAVLLTALGLFRQMGPVHAAVEAVKAFIYLRTGWAEILYVYADRILPLLCLLLVVTARAAAGDESCFSAVLYTVAACVILFMLRPAEAMLRYALPAFCGLALQLSRRQRFSIMALPATAALVLLAFLLTPKAPAPLPKVQQMAQALRHAIEDHLLFTQQRDSFSLTTEGYQPLENRLGGKPILPDRDVMDVETEDPLLLRGKTYDFYTGISWQDTLSSKRYLYNSIYNRSIRTTLFGLDKPLTGADDLETKNVSVHLLSSGTTTLFAPAATREITMHGQRMVLYFNTAGELFLTRNTAGFDRYSFSYLPLQAGDEKTGRIIQACAALHDPYYETAAAQYLPLPSHIQQEVFDLAAAAVNPEATPYEKALQLQHYLQTNYAYSLDVKTPPEKVDFTAYFLLGEKKGYCTYFATAMTVLCRINGIPARYVTGYLVQPGEDGVAHVQSKDAHAWTEIYLNGFGWLPIDATGSAAPPSTPPEVPRNTPTPPPAQPPTAPPTAAPTAQPTATPPSSDIRPTPSAHPSDAPSGRPDDAAVPDAAKGPWLWLILIALVAAACALRYYTTLPAVRARSRKADASLVYFRALTEVLGQMKLRRNPSETLHAFAQRVAEQDCTDAAQAIIGYAASLYGNKPGQADALQKAFDSLLRRLPFKKRLRFRLLCMLGKG